MKTPRICLALFSFVVATLGGASAQSPRPAFTEGAWTVTPAYVSHYVFRGVVLDGASFQPTIDYTTGNLSLGLWSSVALAGSVTGDSDPEVDFYASYHLPVIDSVSLVPGLYLYGYPDADRADGTHPFTVEPSLGANLLLGGVQFTPKVYYDLTLEGATWELTAAYALPLTQWGTELDFSATVGTFRWGSVTADASPAVKNSGDYWQIGVAVPVQISLRSRITLGVNYSEGSDNFYREGASPRESNPDARGQTWLFLSYALSL